MAAGVHLRRWSRPHPGCGGNLHRSSNAVSSIVTLATAIIVMMLWDGVAAACVCWCLSSNEEVPTQLTCPAPSCMACQVHTCKPRSCFEVDETARYVD